MVPTFCWKCTGNMLFWLRLGVCFELDPRNMARLCCFVCRWGDLSVFEIKGIQRIFRPNSLWCLKPLRRVSTYLERPIVVPKHSCVMLLYNAARNQKAETMTILKLLNFGVNLIPSHQRLYLCLIFGVTFAGIGSYSWWFWGLPCNSV